MCSVSLFISRSGLATTSCRGHLRPDPEPLFSPSRHRVPVTRSDGPRPKTGDFKDWHWNLFKEIGETRRLRSHLFDLNCNRGRSVPTLLVSIISFIRILSRTVTIDDNHPVIIIVYKRPSVLVTSSGSRQDSFLLVIEIWRPGYGTFLCGTFFLPIYKPSRTRSPNDQPCRPFLLWSKGQMEKVETNTPKTLPKRGSGA